MAKLVNVALSKEEADKLYGSSSTDAGDEPRYPWGLCIHLEDAVMKKLGIESEEDVETDEETGDGEVTIAAKGYVSGFSMNRMQDGTERRCLDIQITDIAIAPDWSAEAPKSGAAAKLYGGK